MPWQLPTTPCHRAGGALHRQAPISFSQKVNYNFFVLFKAVVRHFLFC